MTGPVPKTAMAGAADDTPEEGAPSAETDITGQGRLARNVFAGWAGYLTVAVAAFLVPRIMDRRLGQEALGVWDFGWSLASYFALTQLGVGGSVQRYVARYRVKGDVRVSSRMSPAMSSRT